MSRVATIGDIAGVFNGKTPSKSEKRDQGLPILKIKDVTENGIFKGSHGSFVDEGFYKRHAKKRIHKGDTLILNAAHNADYVGSKQFRACEDVDGIIATGEWLIVRPSTDLACSSYVNHWLASDEAKFRIRDLVKGIHLYPKDVARLKIPLPPLEEQKRIAAILDKADAVRRKRQQAIDLTDQLLRSVFLDMFGDPQARGWDMATIEDLAFKEKGSIRTGPFGSQLLHSEFTDQGVAVLGIDNAVENRFRWAKLRFISEEKYQQLKRYTVKPGDLIITIMGTCGRTAIVPDNCPIAINTKHLCCITLNKDICTPEFLHSYFLMHPISRKYLSQTAKGAVMDGLNMGLIKEMPVFVPPIEEQKKYSMICKSLESNKEKFQSMCRKTDKLLGSLTQRAFRGELTKQTEAA